MSDLPLIGITMGDPAGIGPEIVASALTDKGIYQCCRPVVLGDAEILAQALKNSSSNLLFHTISHVAEVDSIFGKPDLLPFSSLKAETIQPGRPTVAGGKAMVAYITKAVELCLNGELDAMVTCPINKALMHRAGHLFDGHTQLISQLTNTDEYVMMLAGERFRVVLATIHCALKDVPKILTVDGVKKTITMTTRALRQDFGISEPRLAVAALNPHAGESGIFGSEEETIITPAVKNALDEGCHVEGPLPADTLFFKAASGKYDAVVAMYHDQGLIPLKLLHFSDAVNITLGLPIVRTSVDHGTAYDIAGTGRADDASLKAAIKLAAVIVKNRKKGQRNRT